MGAYLESTVVLFIYKKSLFPLKNCSTTPPPPPPIFSKMAILNVIQYTQKVPNNSAPQLPAKPLWTDSGEEPVKSLPISGVAGNSDWQKGPARDSEDTAQVIQGVRADKSGAGGIYSHLLLCCSRVF